MFNVSKARVLVVGDYIVDEYWHCTSGRISPEAPVPVCDLDERVPRHGGAGNVWRNLATLGAQASIIGRDAPEHRKVRVVVGNHQVARVDVVPAPHALDKYWMGIKHTIDQHVRKHKIVVVSDYGRMPAWAIRYTITTARTFGVPVIVDPKFRAAKVYAGATLITPNFKEWQAMGGKLPRDNAMALVTKGADGMTLIRKRQKPVHFKTTARDVVDVTGAGDTVVATVAACLAAGYHINDAIGYANQAAGIACGKFGTYAVRMEDINS